MAQDASISNKEITTGDPKPTLHNLENPYRIYNYAQTNNIILVQ